MEYRVDGDLIMLYAKPYSIYLRGTIDLNTLLEGSWVFVVKYNGKIFLLTARRKRRSLLMGIMLYAA